jgi:carotenoid 1,2-hydratase
VDLGRSQAIAQNAAADREGWLEPVPAGGYAWWYVDALSDDGQRALTAIFFIGSVFSPDYARAGVVPAENYLGVNLALYDRGRHAAWVMTEYPAARLVRRADGIEIAGSSMVRDGNRLRVVFREKTAPFFASLAGVGAPVEGELMLDGLCEAIDGIELGEGSGHSWRVPMPRARIRASFKRPDFSFEGFAYHDTNRGATRLEKTLARWSWARFLDDDRVRVLYTTLDKAGQRVSVLVDARDGDAPLLRAPRLVGDVTQPEPKKARWGLPLPDGFAVEGGACHVEQLLDVAPFYARYVARLDGGGLGIGEHLDLDRFDRRGIQFLLRFKTRVQK